MSATTHAASMPAGERGHRRLRYLHQLYARGTSLNAWISRRLAPAGMSVCLLLIATNFIALSQPRDSAYQIFSLAAALACIGLVWAAVRRAKVEVTRHLPPHGTVGMPLRYTCEVRNRSKRRLSGVTLVEASWDHHPSAATFVNNPEPGEHERNAFDRFFAYYRWQWLIHRGRLFDGGKSATIFDVDADGCTRVTMEIKPRKRGVIGLRDIHMALPDPLRIFQSCQRVPTTSNAMVILPRRYSIPPIELPGGASYRIGSEANTNSIGSHGEFVGLREYRSGDPMRLIHWKSWARTGRPIVKELEDTHYPRHGLVIDTFAGGTQDLAFEELISVAASFAAGIDTRESLLDLMFIGDKAHRVTVGRGVERAEKLLEVLAAVEMSGEDGFTDLAKLVKRHSKDLGSCLVVLLGWDAKRAGFLEDLRGCGIPCVPVIVGFGEKPASAPGHWIDAAHPGRDLARIPIHPEY